MTQRSPVLSFRRSVQLRKLLLARMIISKTKLLDIRKKMVDGAGDRRVKPLIKLISEVYDNPNANEIFEMELDRALEEGINVIVIEPTRLGDETARWIAIGNCLHKTAVLAGMGSIATAFIWTDKPYFCLPLGILSILCTSIYTLSWQFDPCVKYQVETDFTKLFADYPQLSLLSTSPVILVRKDNSRRKMLHSGISLIATIFCIWRLYDAFA